MKFTSASFRICSLSCAASCCWSIWLNARERFKWRLPWWPGCCLSWMFTAWIEMGGTCSSPHLQHQMLKLNSNQDVLWDAANYLKGPKNAKVNNNCRGKMDWSKVFKSIHWICMVFFNSCFAHISSVCCKCFNMPSKSKANHSKTAQSSWWLENAWDMFGSDQQSASFVLSFLSSTSALPESSTRMIFPGKSLPCPGQSTKSMGSICFSKNAKVVKLAAKSAKFRLAKTHVLHLQGPPRSKASMARP